MKKLFMTSFFALILTLAACGGDSGEEDPATNEDTGTPTEEDSGSSEIRYRFHRHWFNRN